MAYTKDIEWIKLQIRSKHIIAYKIQDERKNTLAENEELSPDLVISELESIIPNLSGMVLLTLSPKNKTEKQAGGMATRQDLNITLQLGNNNMPVQAIGNIPIDNTKIFNEIEQRFNDKLEAQKIEFKHLNEIESLKRELAEAKEANPTIKMLEPHLPGIIAGIFGGANAPAAIAGMPKSENTQEFSAEDDERAENSVKRLLAVDPDFLNVLERLAAFAENNIQGYNYALGMLPK